MKYRIFTILGLGSLLIGYLSLRSSPAMSELAWLPDWLSGWADQPGNEDRRTAVPFIALSFYLALEAILAFPRSLESALGLWLLGAYSLLLVLCSVEALQMLLPHRTPSIGDVGWGSLGIFIGALPLVFWSLVSPTLKKQRR